MIENDKKPQIMHVSILFSVVIFLFLVVGYRVQSRNFYSGVLITEFLLLLLPSVIYLVVLKFDIKNTIKLNTTRFLNYFVVFWIMVFAIPLAGIFNAINLWAVNSIFGKIVIEQTPRVENLTGLILNVLVIGVSAGICEEFLFRGVIQKGFEDLGTTKSILLTAFLFGLMHMDFQKLFGTFILGAIIGFIVYKTNSIYCGMFAHFTNNAIAVLVSYLSVKAEKFLNVFRDSGIDYQEPQLNLNEILSTFREMSKEQLIIVIFTYGIIFLFVFAVFSLLIATLTKLNKANTLKRSSITLPKILKPLLWLTPGLILVLIIYYAEGLGLKDINNTFTETLKIFLGS
jgi:uncharacterized protein